MDYRTPQALSGDIRFPLVLTAPLYVYTMLFETLNPFFYLWPEKASEEPEAVLYASTRAKVAGGIMWLSLGYGVYRVMKNRKRRR